MTVQELLKPRFKVIADYPGTEFEIGDVLKCADDETYRSTCSGWMELSKYPAIFKKLDWHEERKLEEMPEYLKESDGRVFKVDKWEIEKRPAYWKHGESWGTWLSSFYSPATQEEYEAFINQPA